MKVPLGPYSPPTIRKPSDVLSPENLRRVMKATLADHIGPEATRPPFEIPANKRSEARSFAFDAVVDQLAKDNVFDAIKRAFLDLLEEAMQWRNMQMYEREQELDRQQKELNDQLERLTQIDPILRRILACKETVEQMLPHVDSKNTFVQQQAIRSRGLVMAALAGMTNVGGTFKDEEAVEEKS